MKKLIYLFTIFILVFININKATSFEISQKNLIKPYCVGKINFNSTDIHTRLTQPKKIEIIFDNQRKYYKNFFKLIKILSGNKKNSESLKEVKKYQTAKVYVHYNNKIKCEFKAKIKIAGSGTLHILNDKFISSLNVKILEGNILHKSRFRLYTPVSRFGKNELFLTTLFQEMNILTPLTFFIDTEINGKKIGKMIFQETISQNTISHNKRNKGMIVKMNKRSQFMTAIPSYNKDTSSQINLGLVSNDGFFTNELKINALDKMNYLILQNYDLHDLFINSKSSSLFEAAMLASGALHGLAREDRRFFYDFLNDNLEPIYFDGKSRIFTDNVNTDLEIKIFTKNQKNGALKAIETIKKINKENFVNKLDLKGLTTDTNTVDLVFKKIINNLNIILKSKELIIENKFSNKYFSEHKNKDKFNFKIAFGGKKNIFTICEFDLSNCKIKPVTRDQANKIFNNQITKIGKKKVLYLRSSIEAYKNNIFPINEISKMKKISINSNFNIFYNNKISIEIDKINKIINFDMIDSSGRVIIKSDNISDWIFNLNGFNDNFDYKDISYNNLLPNSCITFIDSTFEKINLSSKNTECPNTFQFINSQGSIKDININKAKYDAFDADFSNLKIENIEVDYAGQECVGVKTGNYEIINANLNNCSDKAISSGELSNLIINKINITNSHFGLAAKDSSKIIANNVTISNSDLCLFAYRGKYEYQSSLIVTKKDKYYCDNQTYFVQKGSLWKNLSADNKIN